MKVSVSLLGYFQVKYNETLVSLCPVIVGGPYNNKSLHQISY